LGAYPTRKDTYWEKYMPRIIDKLTGIPIQYYKKLLNGYFYLENRILDVGEKHKNKLAVVRINEEKNEVEVFPDGDLSQNPFVFNKTTGKLKKKNVKE
jgi:hypothetical protein